MDEKIKSTMLNIRRIIDMSADGASTHDLNKNYYALQALVKNKKTHIDIPSRVRYFKNAMSNERLAFKKKPKNIINLWDALDELIRITCPHPKKQHIKIGDKSYCNWCFNFIEEKGE